MITGYIHNINQLDQVCRYHFSYKNAKFEGLYGILRQNFEVDNPIDLIRGRFKINAGGGEVQGINLDGTVLADWSLPNFVV